MPNSVKIYIKKVYVEVVHTNSCFFFHFQLISSLKSVKEPKKEKEQHFADISTYVDLFGKSKTLAN